MLKLIGIEKDYPAPDGAVHALRGVSLHFRKSEFVSILGASGCGKTTLLNIIGGLDHYTAGDLLINGVSTKKYTGRDWDTYRNHSVGFVFQSYNLIPHQTVLANVELSLTLSGVSAEERRARAVAVLEKVGLSDQINKLPRQLSGGQMQRVAIARSLINDPEILLADEPTGALDSATSVQVMELLKEIAAERLVIMVTHNPELADTYSTRIIRLKDGEVLSDSAPYDGEEKTAEAVGETSDSMLSSLPNVEECACAEKRKKGKKRYSSMSFLTALSLSFRNLMTKKARTFMVSFAGSIGIIGIALILSVSTGVQALIDSLERSTMSSYPLTIQATSLDMAAMLGSMMENGTPNEDKQDGYIYSHDVVSGMITGISAGIAKNDLVALKKYLEGGSTDIASYVNDIKYSYMTGLNTYYTVEKDGKTSYVKNMRDYYDLFEMLGMGSMGESSYGTMNSMMGSMSAGTSAWTELIGDRAYWEDQYTLVSGAYPEDTYDVVLFVSENNEISDYVLYMLGFLDVEVLKDYVAAQEKYNVDPEKNPKPEPLPATSYKFEDIVGKTFRLLTDADHYTLDERTGLAREKTEAELNATIDAAPTLRISGILKPSENAVAASVVGGIGYSDALMPVMIDRIEQNAVVKAQKENEEVDIFSGNPFKVFTEADYPFLRAQIEANPQLSAMLPMLGVSIDDKAAIINLANKYMASQGTVEANYTKLGVVSEDSPSAISIYPKDFDSKDAINGILKSFSEKHSELTYTDTIALMLSSVSTIVNAISYVLVAFVAISLVVSSIMIGVITYISVLERTKEIGILRALGASKRDISRVFNAETLVVGFAAGLIGILFTLGCNVIINIILYNLTELAALKAVLDPVAALVLLGVSMLLTFVAGLVPSRIAARKDPVEALRSE